MERNEILKQVNAIFIDTLDDDDVVIEEITTANDVEEWDSLTHIQLVVAIEKHFKIRFTSKEIQSWNNVGEMLNCIQEKGI
ncbi:acyl carrier protein [Flavobacterium psychrotolerans]|uniref:Acyl carrier protein n=1 Tax=Flavobacterium psychrotolerans TaxID=2169410 RepID=A0A2U1JFY0_9FLAO|nr:acyl carrier protein [Flavobacterium psychrotolerans]PWA04052.1 acyl carrier protein [Flavobacterium psychrotolerans]